MNTDFFNSHACLAYTAAVCQQFEQLYKETNLAEDNLATAEKSLIDTKLQIFKLTYKLTDLLDLNSFRIKSKDRNVINLSGKMKPKSLSINGLNITPEHSWSQEITLPSWVQPEKILATICPQTRTLSISHE